MPRDKSDDAPAFAGSLYVKRDKTYNIELPNGDAIVICYTKDDKGPKLEVISSSWCTKTDVDVQAGNESKRFKPGPKAIVFTKSQTREILRRLMT